MSAVRRIHIPIQQRREGVANFSTSASSEITSYFKTQMTLNKSNYNAVESIYGTQALKLFA